MGKLHLKFTSDLDVPCFQALHEGRVVLYGDKQRKRVIQKGSKGGLYIKMGSKQHPKKRVYLVGNGGLFVVTKGVRQSDAQKRQELIDLEEGEKIIQRRGY